jgi:hypothetical protein
MISDQLDAFPGHERFVHALLGLLSTFGALVEALEQERQDDGRCAGGPIMDLALGAISLRRTLRATLGAAASARDDAAEAPSEEELVTIEPGSLLR